MGDATRFLSGRLVWEELRTRTAKAKAPISAAVAYFGKDGSELLPLKKGDTLLVDLSLGAVRQGVTDPREIQKLTRRGVRVFTRASLHAKFYLVGDVLICGSANVSNNSLNVLDEACVMTSSRAAIREARKAFNRMCSEPVSELYLEQAIAEYQPPRFKAAVAPRRRKGSQSARAKLWLIGGITPDKTWESDEHLAKVLTEAEEDLSRQDDEVRFLRFRGRKPGVYDRVQRHSRIIDVMRHGPNRRHVGPPSLLLRKHSYTSASGRPMFVLVLATPIQGEPMSYTEFRRRAGEVMPSLNRTTFRTRPVEDTEAADRLLRLWTPRGKVRKGRST